MAIENVSDSITHEAIASLEIELDTSVTGFVAGIIRIELEGEGARPTEIPVDAVVRPRNEFVPAELDLPRSSTSGSVFTGTVMLRNWDGEAVKILPKSVPSFITLQFHAQTAIDQQVVDVTLDPERFKREMRENGNAKVSIVCDVQSNKNHELMDLIVKVKE